MALARVEPACVITLSNGGLVMLYDVMAAHASAPYVIEAACGALANLSYSPTVRH